MRIPRLLLVLLLLSSLARAAVSLDDRAIARDTYLLAPHAVKNRGHVGWNQSAIFAACLGLVNEAARLTTLKLQDSDRHRFPTF